MQDYLYSYICIGNGSFNNVYGRNGSYVTAGEKDYAECMNEIERQKEDYYKQLGVAPGVPTMKGAYGDPENTKEDITLSLTHSATMTCHRVGFRPRSRTPHRIPTLVHL